MNTKIEVRDLTKIYYNNKAFPEGLMAIQDVNFNIIDGEFLCIVGPSGCGKTTILNIISGIDTPTEGQVLFKDTSITKGSGIIGYMLQKDLLLPWRNVFQNIMIGLEIQNKVNNKSRELVMEYIREYGLNRFEKAYPKSLSGGMKQRVALIRTLVCKPDIILLDEPFAAVDYETRLELERDLLKITKKRNTTVLFVTHNIDEAISLADRILVLTERPGTIKSEYNIDLTLAEKDPINARKSLEFSRYFSKIWDDFKEIEK